MFHHLSTAFVITGLCLMVSAAGIGKSNVDLQRNSKGEESVDEIFNDVSTDVESNEDEAIHNKRTIRLGDMELTVDQYNDLYGTRKRRFALNLSRYQWTGGVVNYYIQPGKFGTRGLGEIKKAISEWERTTCLKFKKFSSPEQSKYMITVTTGRGCSSSLGMVGQQKLRLAGGCRRYGIIIHEFGHAIGFLHQQMRPDRNKYITILTQNIEAKKEGNFRAETRRYFSSFGVPYDYYSIMHYGTKSFSKNGQKTITTKGGAFDRIIGRRNRLSFGDIKIANILYKCGSRCGITCPGEGFPDKYCRCLCRGDPTGGVTKVCAGKPSTKGPTTPSPDNCKNVKKECDVWAGKGYCNGRTSEFMNVNCRKSCNRCGVACEDKSLSCPPLVKSGYCKGGNYVIMKKFCPKSCGHC